MTKTEILICSIYVDADSQKYSYKNMLQYCAANLCKRVPAGTFPAWAFHAGAFPAGAVPVGSQTITHAGYVKHILEMLDLNYLFGVNNRCRVECGISWWKDFL